LNCTGIGAGERLAEDVETAAYRVLQEALHNAVRHACAGRIEVDLTRAGWDLTVTVRDDGVGFAPDPEEEGSRSLGLQSMRERAEALGGSFDLRTAPGAGTTVTVLLPVEGGRDAGADRR
jgi:signal transduction histidine kinase